jgi:hypothetical protein
VADACRAIDGVAMPRVAIPALLGAPVPSARGRAGGWVSPSADAGHTIARIERALAAPISLGDSLLIRVTASSGLATGRASRAVELADAALCRSKRTRSPGH